MEGTSETVTIYGAIESLTLPDAGTIFFESTDGMSEKTSIEVVADMESAWASLDGIDHTPFKAVVPVEAGVNRTIAVAVIMSVHMLGAKIYLDNDIEVG